MVKDTNKKMITGEYRAKTTPVGSFLANGFGLSDMHGNLWEWCLDEENNYNNAPKDDSNREDINSRDRHKIRTVRGGSWATSAFSCRSSSRTHCTATQRYTNIGLRVVAVPASTPSRQSS